FYARLSGDVGQAKAHGLFDGGREKQRRGRRHALRIDDHAAAFRREGGRDLGGIGVGFGCGEGTERAHECSRGEERAMPGGMVDQRSSMHSVSFVFWGKSKSVSGGRTD